MDPRDRHASSEFQDPDGASGITAGSRNSSLYTNPGINGTKGGLVNADVRDTMVDVRQPSSVTSSELLPNVADAVTEDTTTKRPRPRSNGPPKKIYHKGMLVNTHAHRKFEEERRKAAALSAGPSSSEQRSHVQDFRESSERNGEGPSRIKRKHADSSSKFYNYKLLYGHKVIGNP